MKIAVSSDNQTDITGHAGHCLQFWVYDIGTSEDESKQLIQLSKEQSFHASAKTEPHPLDDVEVLISGSMCRRLADRLESKGIKPIVTPETDPDAAVAAYLVGSLVTGTPKEHEHTHDHPAKPDHAGECRHDG